MSAFWILGAAALCAAGILAFRKAGNRTARGAVGPAPRWSEGRGGFGVFGGPFGGWEFRNGIGKVEGEEKMARTENPNVLAR